MTIYEQLLETFRGEEGKTFSTRVVKQRLQQRYGTNPGSVIPSDYCYNRVNRGIPFTKHLFEYVSPGTYLYRGPGYPYSGPVFMRSRGTRDDLMVGQMIKGRYQPGAER